MKKAIELQDLPKNYFGYQRNCLYYLGVSFRPGDGIFYRIVSGIWVMALFVTYGVLEFTEIFINRTDRDKLTNLLSYFGTDIIGIVKLGVLVYNRLRIGIILDKLENGVFTPNVKRGGTYEVVLIKQYIALSRGQTLVYQILCFMVLSIGVIGTLITRLRNPGDPTKWELPFLPFSLADMHRSPTFEIVWLHQSVFRLLYCTIVTSTDMLISGTLAQISAQCRLLQNAIRKMVENAYEETVERDKSYKQNIRSPEEINPRLIPWDIMEKHLTVTINYHLEIINISDEFEDIFTYMILCEFLGTLCILCFTMYHASLFDLFSMRAMQDFSYVGAIVVQVFFTCYWGNEVQLQSQAVADACYDANFVGADLRLQKSLAFIIRRSQNPIVLTAAKFADLSLRTYVWLIRASYSYYMVLRSHNN